MAVTVVSTVDGPVNPNATADCADVLRWLTCLPVRTDTRVVAGQHLTYWGANHTQTYYQDYVVDLQTATGHWLGLLGTDFGNFSLAADIAAACTNTLIPYWNNGGLIHVGVHFQNPWTSGSSWDTGGTRNLTELVDPASAVYATWISYLDTVAVGLQALETAGVVVLFRPLHEMTYMDNFWWDTGAHGGVWSGGRWYPNVQPFVDLWRFVFDYFTYTKGLNNLLWIYAAADTDNWCYTDSMYPGEGYVDIVAVDVYDDDFIMDYPSGYTTLTNIGKPFAITEAGWSSASPPPTLDARTYINSIRANYPRTCFVYVWASWAENICAISECSHAQEFLDDSWIITRPEVNW